MYDTVFASGYFLRYTLDSTNKIIITWGNSDFKRTTKDELYPGWAPSEFKCEWNNYIGMFHSCGSPCWSHFLLPKNETDSIIFFDFPIAFDTKRDYILYRGPTYHGNDFIVENIVSRKKQKIILDAMSCDFFMDGIDSVAFDSKGLYVKWITNQMDNPKWTKEKIFKLNN